MTGIDWPDEFERTPAEDRGSYPGNITVSHRVAFESIVDQLARWGATPERVTFAGPAYASESNIPHVSSDPDDPGVAVYFRRDDEHADAGFALACDKYTTQLENARAIALYVKRKRLAERCGVTTAQSEFETARLPPAEGEAVAAPEPPHEVLGVAPDAPTAVVKGAFRELVKVRHPDHGGTSAAFQQLTEAKEAMLDE